LVEEIFNILAVLLELGGLAVHFGGENIGCIGAEEGFNSGEDFTEFPDIVFLNAGFFFHHGLEVERNIFVRILVLIQLVHCIQVAIAVLIPVELVHGKVRGGGVSHCDFLGKFLILVDFVLNFVVDFGADIRRFF